MSEEEGGMKETSHIESKIDELITNDTADLLTGTIPGLKNQISTTKNQIKKVQKKQKSIKERIRDLTDKTLSYKHDDYDVEEARTLIEEAKAAFSDLELKETEQLLDEAEEALENALYKPFPLLTKDVKLTTTLKKEDEDDSIKALFTFINEEDDVSGDLLYSLSTPKGFKDLKNRHIGEIPPKSEKSTTFNIERKEDDDIPKGSLSELLINGTIAVKSILDLKQGNAKHIVKIKNLSEHHIQDIRIRPIIPSLFTPEFNYRDIDLIRKGEVKTVIFTLSLK